PRYQGHLPRPRSSPMRLYDRAPELAMPPDPTGGITAAQQDRARRRAVDATLASWPQAIAAARLAKAHAPVGARPARDAGVPEAHAPIPGTSGSAARGRLAKPRAPVGGRPARDAGVPGARAPIPGTSGSAAAGRLAKPRAPAGGRPARDAGVPYQMTKRLTVPVMAVLVMAIHDVPSCERQSRGWPAF